MSSQLRQAMDFVKQSSPEFAEFYQNHPRAAGFICARAVRKLKRKHKFDVIRDVEEDLKEHDPSIDAKGSVLTSILVGLMVKIAVEAIYKWLKKRAESNDAD